MRWQGAAPRSDAPACLWRLALRPVRCVPARPGWLRGWRLRKRGVGAGWRSPPGASGNCSARLGELRNRSARRRPDGGAVAHGGRWLWAAENAGRACPNVGSHHRTCGRDRSSVKYSCWSKCRGETDRDPHTWSGAGPAARARVRHGRYPNWRKPLPTAPATPQHGAGAGHQSVFGGVARVRSARAEARALGRALKHAWARQR